MRIFLNKFSTKISTGLTGLKADPLARSNLLKLYENMTKELSDLPETYAYRIGMEAVLGNRIKLLKNEGISDFDLEKEIGEGQLEELKDQAEEEFGLLKKIKNDWRPFD